MDTPAEIQILISERAAYLSRVHVGVTIPLLTLCLITFYIRLYIRARPQWRFGWDDGFIVAGFVSINVCRSIVEKKTDWEKAFAIADWALLQYEMFMTPQLLSFPVATNSMKLAYLAIPVWGCSMTCIKISAALTLLRIPQSKIWNIGLYFITGLQSAYFIGNTVFIFVACQPLQGIWGLSVTDARCLGPRASQIASNVGSAINVTTDVLLSLAPMVILWNLRRPLRERILVCALTGVGLFASISSLVKTVIVQQWGDPNVDTWALAVSIATWTILEQFLAVLAACSPSIKGPLQRLLGSFGVLLTSFNSHISFIEMRRSTRGTAPRGEQDGVEQNIRHPPPVYSRGDRDDKAELSKSMTGTHSDWSGGDGEVSPASHDDSKHRIAKSDSVNDDMV
jgi:hypothetical protein